MSNDAKLGLVLGVAIVLVIGLVFFRSDASAARNSAVGARQPTTNGYYTPRHSPPAFIDPGQQRP